MFEHLSSIIGLGSGGFVCLKLARPVFRILTHARIRSRSPTVSNTGTGNAVATQGDGVTAVGSGNNITIDQSTTNYNFSLIPEENEFDLIGFLSCVLLIYCYITWGEYIAWLLPTLIFFSILASLYGLYALWNERRRELWQGTFYLLATACISWLMYRAFLATDSSTSMAGQFFPDLAQLQLIWDSPASSAAPFGRIFQLVEAATIVVCDLSVGIGFAALIWANSNVSTGYKLTRTPNRALKYSLYWICGGMFSFSLLLGSAIALQYKNYQHLWKIMNFILP